MSTEKRQLLSTIPIELTDSLIEPAAKRLKAETIPNDDISNGITTPMESSDSDSGNDSTNFEAESYKQIRYDRQLRLWGDHGQALLETSSVCLLNATATGAEILKSLVLPGTGSFTIVDNKAVTPADLGINFFLEPSCIGQSRAKVVCEFLRELNPDVEGNFANISPESLLSNNIGFLDKFSLVICSGLRKSVLLSIADYLWQRRIPLMVCNSSGLIGYLRVVLNEHPVIESHPENPLPNFLLDCLFDEAREFADRIDLDQLDRKDHSHTPYLVLLVKALDIWRNRTPDRQFPQKYAEKREIKDILQSMRRPDKKGSLDEENFVEAVAAVNSALVVTSVPEHVLEILDYASTLQPPSTDVSFWIFCQALRRFVEENTRLPVRGTLPDMTSDSERYVSLQTIYSNRADTEAALIHSYAVSIAAQYQIPADQLTQEEAKRFCKNSAFLRLVRGKNLRQEYELPLQMQIEDRMNAWYPVARVCDEFYDDKHRHAGSDETMLQSDKQELLDRLGKLVSTEVDGNLIDACTEMCRYGGRETHAVSAFIGGVAAQEAVKLLTKQYVPIDNTYIFDGNTGNGAVFRC